MGHGRETTLSLNFKTSCISIPNINCIYITGTSWHIVFGIEFCGLLRCVTVGRRGEGERREKTFYLFFLWSRIFVAAGSKQLLWKCLPYEAGSEVAWATTALQLTAAYLYVFTVYSTSVDGILRPKMYMFLYAHTDYCRRVGTHTVQRKRLTS